jgi:hypothetical protein
MKSQRSLLLFLACGIVYTFPVSISLLTPLAGLAQTRVSSKSYRVANLYTIQLPTDWYVEVLEDNYLMITNYKRGGTGGIAPTQAIKTDIVILPESFEAIVRRNSSGTRTEDDSRILRRGALKLGGRDAYRIWTTESQFDFPDAVVTYVRYGKGKTASIISFYTAQNSAAVPLIERIHGSFRSLQP